MPSLLRQLGFVLAIVLLLLAVWSGRRRPRRSLVLPLAVSGVGLLIVVVFPDAVRVVQGLIGLESVAAGGVITAL